MRAHSSPQVSRPIQLPADLRWRVGRRFLPVLFLAYVVAFLNRVNVSYAALDISAELHLSPQDLGAGMGIFFMGYLLLEVPSAILAELWSARKWIARIMISRGLGASCLGCVESKRSFFFLRFLLGAGESGFFPGIAGYLSHWFVEEDKGKAIAMFMVAVPVSYAIWGPISAALLQVHWLSLSGWRWMFILEGIPALLLGIAVLWILDDQPSDARWLAPSERELLQAAIMGERAGKPQRIRPFHYLRQPLVLLLAAILLCSAVGAYGFGLWLPTILAGVSDGSHSLLALLASLPYAVSTIFMLWTGWHSDKTGELKWHTAIPLFVSAIGLAVGLAHPRGLPSVVLIYCLVGSGVYSYLPSFWSLPTRYFAGTAGAVSIGIINSIANLGGLAGPYLVGYIRAHTGSFDAALLFLSSALFASGLLVLLLRDSVGGRPTDERSRA